MRVRVAPGAPSFPYLPCFSLIEFLLEKTNNEIAYRSLSDPLVIIATYGRWAHPHECAFQGLKYYRELLRKIIEGA